MNSAQQWVIDHPETSSDYANLIDRLRKGEQIEFMMIFNGQYKTGTAIYRMSRFGEVFSLHFDGDEFQYAGQAEFRVDCLKFGLVFQAKRDFLKDTKRMLEIAKNADEFKAVSVPLNTLADIDALLALMGHAEALN